MKSQKIKLYMTIVMFILGAAELYCQSRKYEDGCEISASNISYRASLDTVTQITASTIRIDNCADTKRYIFFNSAEEKKLNDDDFFLHRFFRHAPNTFYQIIRDELSWPIFGLDILFIKPISGRESFLIVIEGIDDADDFIQNNIRIITEEQLRSHKKLHFIPDMDYCWAFYRHDTLLIPQRLYEEAF